LFRRPADNASSICTGTEAAGLLKGLLHTSWRTGPKRLCVGPRGPV